MSREGPSSSPSMQHQINNGSSAAGTAGQPTGGSSNTDGRIPSKFTTYLAVKSTYLPETSISAFSGAVAGIASGIVTCPLDVIKTRLQAQGSFRRTLSGSRLPNAHLYHGFRGTARTIWQQDGLRGMYRGLGPMLLGYLPTWAVYMSIYENSRTYYCSHIGTHAQYRYFC
jgi:solute carrier family 25 (mitochondrial folate transporter), member 32